MQRQLLLLLSLLLLTAGGLRAQGFSGGFRAGLNFMTFDGDQETDASGMTLEEFDRTTGFHVSATFAYGFTDLIGVKADLMYTQKGAERLFEGPSYFYLYNNNQQETRISGDMRSELDVFNSYIDIPVVVYYRLGGLEIEGGLSAGLLINSRASGGATFTNTIYGPDTEIVFGYDFNYSQDEIGILSDPPLANEPIPGTNFFPPATFGAFYNDDSSDRVYNRLDFGLVFGLAYFLNNGLYVGARYQHGLSDVTKGERDLRKSNSPFSAERQYNEDDVDNNRVIQASVGFRF